MAPSPAGAAAVTIVIGTTTLAASPAQAMDPWGRLPARLDVRVLRPGRRR
ncbi:hypothetical protein [Nonomuraea sp. NPDC049784]